MTSAMPRTKLCQNCGGEFARPDGSNNISWGRRLYCSRSCAHEVHYANHKVASLGIETGAIATASDNLLRALLRFGAKNDGLPGLSATRFRELAREHGIAA